MTRFTVWYCLFVLGTAVIGGQETHQNKAAFAIDISKFEDAIRHWRQGPGKAVSYERFDSSDIRNIADNLLKFQNPDGGWPKNIDWLGKLDYKTVWDRLSSLEKHSTIDNRTTYSQIEYLAKAYAVTKEDRYRQNATRGLEFLLSSQNASGGWRGSDVDAITYNDEAMAGVMNLLLDIVEGRQYFNWMESFLKKRVRESLQRAIEVTLKCQIAVDGKKTGWCQQHDHVTLQPIKARTYELPSIVSLETASIVEFLLRIKNPDKDVKVAVSAAVARMDQSRIRGIRLERFVVDSTHSLRQYRRFDSRVVSDTLAPPIWARYYEIDTNKPFFCNRDGKCIRWLKSSLNAVWGMHGMETGPREYSAWNIRFG